MQTSLRRSLTFLAFAGLSVSLGCESPAPPRQIPWVPVQIMDLSNVAGKWEGIMRRVPPAKRHDMVSMIISPDGKFRFVSVRTIGVMSGEGSFALTNGKLTASSERGTIEATLFEAEGQRMLKAEGKASDGMEYNAEMTQVK